jgi:hypothetical protein
LTSSKTALADPSLAVIQTDRKTDL